MGYSYSNNLWWCDLVTLLGVISVALYSILAPVVSIVGIVSVVMCPTANWFRNVGSFDFDSTYLA